MVEKIEKTTLDRKGYIIDLGLVDYGKAWELQHRFWTERIEGTLPDVLLLLEHPHVITLGRRGNRSHLIASSEELERRRIPIFHVERGGDVTYHGPGQMVTYPILNLKDNGYHLVRYVDQLEEVILHTLRDFGIEGKRDRLNRGVWVGQDKVASIGVAIKRWVSFHGFALNYETDLAYFDLIHPCGLEGIRMTSIGKILGEKISRKDVLEKTRFHFKEIFKRDWQEKGIEEILNFINREA